MAYPLGKRQAIISTNAGILLIATKINTQTYGSSSGILNRVPGMIQGNFRLIWSYVFWIKFPAVAM